MESYRTTKVQLKALQRLHMQGVLRLQLHMQVALGILRTLG